jgi:hypothetical protein
VQGALVLAAGAQPGLAGAILQSRQFEELHAISVSVVTHAHRPFETQPMQMLSSEAVGLRTCPFQSSPATGDQHSRIPSQQPADGKSCQCSSRRQPLASAYTAWL